MSRVPTYTCYIDWFGHGGLNSGLSNWQYLLDGFQHPASAELSTDQAYRGEYSLKIVDTASSGSSTANSRMFKPFTAVTGVPMTATMWVYIPSGSFTGGLSMEVFSVNLVSYGFDTTTVHDTWVPLEIAFTPTTSNQLVIGIKGAFGTIGNGTFYIGWSQIQSDYDDVSCDFLLTRSVPSIEYGRDKAVEFADMKVGSGTFMLNNSTGKYNPTSVTSPIAAGLVPNRQIVISAIPDSGQEYTLFNGFTQDYVLESDINNQSVSIPCVDYLSRLGDIDISTDLYPSIRTGDAFQAVIEAAGFYDTQKIKVELPFDSVRIEFGIDTGATTLRWWSFKGKALDGLKEIMKAEGPPSLFTMGSSGIVRFQDRHHRIRPSFISTPAFKLVACAEDVTDPSTEFPVTDGTSIDFGWETFFNRIVATGSDTRLGDDISVVWTDPEDSRTFTGTTTITAELDHGFIDGQSPVQGQFDRVDNRDIHDSLESSWYMGVVPEDADYVVENGEVILSSYQQSGTQVSITFVANGTATISGLRFRARTVEDQPTELTFDDAASQTYYKSVKTFELDSGSAGTNDVQDIALWILRQNSSMRPRAELVMQNISEDALAAILNASLSQVITVDNHLWELDSPFHIESLRHQLASMGRDHKLTISAEAVDVIGFQSPEFTFNTADHGFDQGVFGSDVVHTDQPFILGTSELDSTDEVWY